MHIDQQGIIQQVSQSSTSFLQLPTSVLQESIQLYIQPEDMQQLVTAQEMAIKTENKQFITCRLLRQKVVPVWVDCHILPLKDESYLLVAFNATHWKENEAKLAHLSTHDALTGLPNRVLLDDRINMSIRTAQREKKSLALILLDLDSFKKINNTLGHQIGDKLIKAIVERLQGYIRRSDTLARTGGNEFSLIMMGVEESSIELIVKKILVAIQRSFYISGHCLHISAGLGVVIYPEQGEDSSVLYRRAEIAMHQAKSQGKNRWEIYHSQIDSNDHGDLSLESAIHEGIKNGEFTLHYQPIFCAQTNKLKGAEALMRWNSSSYGTVPPIKFIPLAENNGLIRILGAWALRSACRQAKSWQEAGYIDFYVSVNVSPRQFVQKDFMEMMNRALSESGLSPKSLMLEITEGVLMENPQRSITILSQLRDAGVKIAIDDFGTGYSSLAYLKKFPLSVLKIDKAFIDNVVENIEDKAIVIAIMDLAQGLSLDVVAEGVENEPQRDFLKQKGCNLIQGYLMGKPVSPKDFHVEHIA